MIDDTNELPLFLDVFILKNIIEINLKNPIFEKLQIS